ncbi:hypothetical protein [Crateriforma conspicua]|uniref:hypothetical protein n=1 Tax=Crateriforma conspicua TaxID=2527996 RepID=UPI001E2C6B0F|nr:hypothetical protein [Crateriforma conspicua]
MLHGAAVNSGKAFFVPADGVCWESMDPEVDDADKFSVHYLSLWTDVDDQPLRTGQSKRSDAKLCSPPAKA